MTQDDLDLDKINRYLIAIRFASIVMDRRWTRQIEDPELEIARDDDPLYATTMEVIRPVAEFLEAKAPAAFQLAMARTIEHNAGNRCFGVPVSEELIRSLLSQETEHSIGG